MRTFSGQNRGRVLLLVSLAVGVYILGYLGVRQHRLSLEYVGATMVFSSADQARQWQAEFPQLQHTLALRYDNDTLLYVLFWPAIQLDAAFSGRPIDSPFTVKPYRLPLATESARQTPPADMPVAAPAQEQSLADDELDLRWFLPLFIAFWCGICAALSHQGGWFALSRRFTRARPADGRRFWFASMTLGPGLFPMGYRSCLFVRLGAAGISIAILPVFRVLHPPLLIPWSAIVDCRRERFWFFWSTTVCVAEPKDLLLFTGRLGRAIHEYWSTAAGQSAQGSPVSPRG